MGSEEVFNGITRERRAIGGLVCAQFCPTLCDPRAVTHQTSLSVEFSRQEYWSGLPFTSPETGGLK